MNASTTKAPEKSRILVVDDHPIVCEGLAELINRQEDICCCGQAGTMAGAFEAIARAEPSMVLLDLRLGNADGLESIKALKARFPQLPILIISQFDETVYAERALRAGASGYVMKERATNEVLQAVRTVLRNEIYVSPKVGLMAIQRLLKTKPDARGEGLHVLSDRETHVFRAVGAGKSSKEIAAELSLSVKTIETYREHIKYKLGLSSGAELVQQAKRAAEADLPGGSA